MTARLRSAERPSAFDPPRPVGMHPRQWHSARLREICGLLVPAEIVAEIEAAADAYAAGMIEREYHRPYQGSRRAARSA